MLLSVVTRCYKRPKMLQTNILSVANQTYDNWEQIFIIDDVGRGMKWADESLYHNRHRVNGDYVLILDDDDCLNYAGFVGDLKGIVTKHNPDIVMIKTDQILRILPDAKVWGRPPAYGRIGSCCYVVRREIWQEYIEYFGGREHGGDYYFIRALFDGIEANKWKVYWLDKICTRVQKVSYGEPEE